MKSKILKGEFFHREVLNSEILETWSLEKPTFENWNSEKLNSQNWNFEKWNLEKLVFKCYIFKSRFWKVDFKKWNGERFNFASGVQPIRYTEQSRDKPRTGKPWAIPAQYYGGGVVFKLCLWAPKDLDVSTTVSCPTQPWYGV